MKKNLNLVIAAITMIGFLFIWDTFVMSRYATPAKPKPVATETNGTVKSAVLSPSELKTTSEKPLFPESNTPLDKDVLTILESENTKVMFLSKGARVASWQVKERDHWIELVEPEKERTVSPLETFQGLPFSVEKKFDNEVVFHGVTADGLQITKRFKLLSEPPFHSFSMQIGNPTATDKPVEIFIPWGNGLDKHTVGKPYDPKHVGESRVEMRGVGFSGEHLKSWKSGMIFGRTIDVVDSQPYQWIGTDNNHFLAVFIADGQPLPGVKVTANRDTSPIAGIFAKPTIKPGEVWALNTKIYVGNKSYEKLKNLGQNLDKSVDFGFFGFISKGLLATLLFFHRFTGNYGWAIILLTICVQVLAFPLTRKSLQFSVQMKQIQPQLKKLQEQFKSDPKRLQVETFNLYKKNGMKFMGMEGCFPMLLQMPIFFAFYSTLNVAYVLRGAPWIFWIRDLGVYDPYYVLPIIMGGGMFLQQKLTSVTADPAQAKMMMFMPLIFTFMFIKLPAGLVLYWCVNSLSTIVAQKFLQYQQAKTPQIVS